MDFHLRAILGKKASQLPTRAKAVHEVESGAKNTKLLAALLGLGAVFELSISQPAPEAVSYTISGRSQ